MSDSKDDARYARENKATLECLLMIDRWRGREDASDASIRKLVLLPPKGAWGEWRAMIAATYKGQDLVTWVNADDMQMLVRRIANAVHDENTKWKEDNYVKPN